MLDTYFNQETERKAQGIPPLPLNPNETAEVCRLLENPPSGKEYLLIGLLKNRISPGVDPAAKVKAEWLAKVAKSKIASPVVPKAEALFILGTMLGGYNVGPLISLLEDQAQAHDAAQALKNVVLVYGGFDKIVELAKTSKAKPPLCPLHPSKI